MSQGKAEIKQEAKKKSTQFSNGWRKAGVNISSTHIMSKEGVKNIREGARAGNTCDRIAVNGSGERGCDSVPQITTQLLQESSPHQ